MDIPAQLRTDAGYNRIVSDTGSAINFLAAGLRWSIKDCCHRHRPLGIISISIVPMGVLRIGAVAMGVSNASVVRMGILVTGVNVMRVWWIGLDDMGPFHLWQ